MSFVDKVDKFVGAHWQGVNIGQLTCLYSGEPSGTFLIKLVSNHIFHFPLGIPGSNWSKAQGGFINCISTSTELCPLVPLVKHKQGSMIDQAMQLQKQGLPAIDQGSAF